MKATVADLRYRMKDVLRALERGEDVSVLHRGKVKGTIIPNRAREGQRVTKHPFFGSRPSDASVEEEMVRLRGGRCCDDQPSRISG